jgi:hypothetical protein
MQFIACGFLVLVFASSTFMSSGALQSVSSGLALVMAVVTGLAGGTYNAVKELEKRVARLENPRPSSKTGSLADTD